MRLIVCAGGTGGGVYPALTVLQTLEKNTHKLLWVGSQDSIESVLVQRADVHFTSIPAAGIHGVGIRALPGNIWSLAKGILAARGIIRKFRPDVMFFTGGYVAVPMALAGRRIPKVLYVPDIEPGMALKFLARFASCIAVTTNESLTHFPDKSRLIKTGYPIRPEFKNVNREDAIRSLGLDPNLPVLLVFGGSQGARSINHALFSILPKLLAHIQVIHISGEANWRETKRNLTTLSDSLKSNYYPFRYLHERMGSALAAADLVVSRAGASSLGEFPHFGLPAILVPYPYAWKYQQVNADYLSRHGAAEVLYDSELTKLFSTITNLLDDSGKLRSMSESMSSLANHHAAEDIANQLQKHAFVYRKINEGGPAW